RCAPIEVKDRLCFLRMEHHLTQPMELVQRSISLDIATNLCVLCKRQQAEGAGMRHTETYISGADHVRFAVLAYTQTYLSRRHPRQLPKHQPQHRARRLTPLALGVSDDVGVLLPLAARQKGLKVPQPGVREV